MNFLHTFSSRVSSTDNMQIITKVYFHDTVKF